MLVITISSPWFQWAFFLEWSVLSGGEEKPSGDVTALAFELITIRLGDYRQVDERLPMGMAHGVLEKPAPLCLRDSGSFPRRWGFNGILNEENSFMPTCFLWNPWSLLYNQTILLIIFQPSESFQLISILHVTCAPHLSLWVSSPFYKWESQRVKELAQT